MNPKIRDLTGELFGKLTVIAYAGVNKSRRAMWRVRCECGNEKTTPGYALVNGDTSSCGCNRITHGLTESKEYQAWTNMLHRCSTPGYAEYHDRGITVCKSWSESFEAFFADVGTAPSKDHSIDRRDNDGNYEPGNVFWATRREQQRNRRIARKHHYRGRVYSMPELAEIAGLSVETIRGRLRSGWSLEDAVNTPKIDRIENLNR